MEKVASVLQARSLPPYGVLAMAMTTWYATRAGAATLANLGRWFDWEPTTLRADVESHRKHNARLFQLTLDELHSMILAHEDTRGTDPHRKRSE
jgi:hypothetical protein